MKTESQIKAEIEDAERKYEHVLTGRLATIDENAPVALMQTSGEAYLRALYWTLGKVYKSKLKGGRFG